MKIEIRDCESGDVEKGAPWKEQFDIHQMEVAVSFGYYQTLLIDGKVAAIAGGIMTPYDIIEVHMLANSTIDTAPIAAARMMRTVGMDNIRRKLNPRKLYITCYENNEFIKNWIQWLGLTFEYRVLEAGPEGTDILGYSIKFNQSVPTTINKGD